MNLLILRFSAIGDVALSIPVLLKFRSLYPEVKLTMVSRKMYRPLFEPLGIRFIAADFSKQHKAVPGLVRLYRQIWKEAKPDIVIDLHSVLRTHILHSLFRLRRIPFYGINKGRPEKKLLTQKKNKIRKPLRHSSQRYADVFEKAGYPLNFDPANPPLPAYQHEEAQKLGKQLAADKPLIGIAPMAGFPGKTWPLAKVRDLMNQLTHDGFRILLFGGPADKEHLDSLADQGKEIINLAGKFDFKGEVVVMRFLKTMISMDSSNMHLATLAGIPVVSIWGATHPDAGFGPLGNNEAFMASVSVNELTCRPCSVFGSKPCFRGDYACLNWLSPADVTNKVHLAITKTHAE